MTEKRARTPLSKVRIPFFEREYAPVKPVRARVRFKTVDDVVFEVCDTSIVPSTYMNRLIYSSRVNRQQSSDVTHPLPNVAADVFEKVMRYCYFHTSRYCDSLLPNQVKEWDDQFMDLDPRQLCELASAAYYLDVKDLIELTCRAIAAIISGKTAEQIRKTFHIENDLAGTIDRVLPSGARRSGREHSPKESNNRDSNDSSQERNQNQMQQENPGAQKSVDELIEWINSSSSKSKKKKKKRHKDKNPAKKSSEFRGSDDALCDSETVHTVSTEAQTPDAVVEERELLSGGRDDTTAADETLHVHRGAEDKEISNESEPIFPNPRQLEEVRTSTDPDLDGESSNSDIAFVSEKLVKSAVMEERRAVIQHVNVLQTSGTSGKSDQPTSASGFGNPDKDEACTSATSEADSVQWVELNPSSQSRAAKQETSAAESSSDAGDSSDTDAEVASREKEPSQVESGECKKGPGFDGDVPSHMNSEERKSDLKFLRPVTQDVTMTDVPENRASHPVLPDERTTEEPFIDCPENMDREVEAFQKRLSITEPLSSHRSPPPSIAERESKSILPSTNADGSWIANGVMTERRVVPRPRGSAGAGKSHDERPVVHKSQEGPERTRPSNGHSPGVKHSSAPKEVLAEVLRIHSEIEEYQKIAAAIDEETARLAAKREKVRDSLAVLNMRERQLRDKYDISDRFP